MGFHPQGVFFKIVQKTDQPFGVRRSGAGEAPRNPVIIPQFAEKDASFNNAPGRKKAPARIREQDGQCPAGYQGDDDPGKTGLQ
jgi:hypothetical protein